jgi:hypothetical protein
LTGEDTVAVTKPETDLEGSPAAPAPGLLSDSPILDSKQDRLGFTAYAEALAELIDSPGVATPLTLSIDAAWGAGKTSLARLIERMLCEWPEDRGDRPHIVVWFNAWMHSDAPNLGTALAAVVGKTVAEHRPAWRRALQPLPSGMLSPEARSRRRALWLLAALVVAVLVAFLPHALNLFGLSQETARWAGLGALAGIPIAGALLTGMLGVAQSAAAFVHDPSSQAASGSMSDVASQFAKLVRTATGGNRRLVIFVDDLDRCQPERALQMCDLASLLLAVPGVVTVLLGDLVSLRSYAAHHFATSDSANGSRSSDDAGRLAAHDAYARSYLDKIVQLDFSLPPSGSSALASVLSGTPPGAPSNGVPADQPHAEMSARPHLWRRLRHLYQHICSRPRRFAAYVGITFGLWLLVIVIVTALDPNFSNNDSDWANTLSGIWFVVTVATWPIAGIGTARRQLANRRARKRTAQIDETIRDNIPRPEEASVATIKGVVAENVSEASGRLVEQRARRLKIERLVVDGNLELVSYLPDLPRSVKRVANRHYLLTSVAVSRDMLGGTPPLTAAHLAKWSLIMERWPDVAAEIIERPTFAVALERSAAADSAATGAPGTSLTAELDGLQVDERDELARLLRDPTSLAPVADRLVFAVPVSAANSRKRVVAPASRVPSPYEPESTARSRST